VSTTPPGGHPPLTPEERRELATRAKRFVVVALVLAAGFLALAVVGAIVLF
jgi:hypothetical protein